MSMSLDGFTAEPNVRADEPTSPRATAANDCTKGWPVRGPTPAFVTK
ncbi:hypothetical protein P3102_01720 [Amycolatopsis sp. QT-25]|nr:hypothetical protein [Amycolatopsis sp. QT-25]WET79999.1 hypothetical protein P3102_01720 [Amycolatopsis sp. QT-25]